MKILHLSTSDLQGGASKGAYRIHQALQKTGLISNMLVMNKITDDDLVIGPKTKLEKGINLLRPTLDAVLLRMYPRREDYYFSPSWLPDNIYKSINKINPDIINLHWICGGFIRPESFRKFRKPLVWTLRDMWGFTGGCHYSYECNHFLGSCGLCPQLNSKKEKDLSRRIWTRKLNAWKGLEITIIAVSHWLAECARQSSLLKNCRIEVIHNGVDKDRFHPMPKEFVRQVLGLPRDKKLILFSALNATADRRKGFHFLKPVFEELVSSGWGNNLELIVMGATQPREDPHLGIKTTYLGKFNDDIAMGLVYAAADVTIVPSIVEAHPKVPLESLSCGTPVVCFDSSGLKDIIEHQINGYRAKCFESNDLARGVAWILQDDRRWHKLSRLARKKVEQECTLEHQADAYIKLYQEILTSQKQRIT